MTRVYWYCRCGFSTTSAGAAFRHRGTESQHHIEPLTREEALARGLELPFDGSGIEQHFAMEESQ
jgi:hypothetical protein